MTKLDDEEFIVSIDLGQLQWQTKKLVLAKPVDTAANIKSSTGETARDLDLVTSIPSQELVREYTRTRHAK